MREILQELATETAKLNKAQPDAIEIQAGRGQIATWLKAIENAGMDVDDMSLVVGYYLGLSTIQIVMERVGVNETWKKILLSDLIYALQQACVQIFTAGQLERITEEELDSIALAVELETFKRVGRA